MTKTSLLFVLCSVALACDSGDENDGGTDSGSTSTSSGTTSSDVSTTSDPATSSTTQDSSTSEASTSTGSTSEEGSSSTGLADNFFNNTIQPIFTGTCGCHTLGPSGTMVAPFQNLSPGSAYAEIVGVRSMQSPGLNRIEPGDLENSYMWRKINNSHLDVGGEGTKMPPAFDADPADVETLRQWILDGAPLDM